jgi:hypothetical protein
VDFDNHCLVAGTMIATAHGVAPIEQVQAGEMVHTRVGLRRVIAAGMTNPAAHVLTVHLSNGRTLTGTASHPVFIQEKGFVGIDALRYGDIIEPWKANASSTTVSRSGATQHPSLCRIDCTLGPAKSQGGGHCTCTERFGETLTARSRWGTTFTIGTGTHPTTPWTIWSCAKRLAIVQKLNSIVLRIWNTWPKSARSQWSGIVPKRGMRGMLSTLSRRIKSANRWSRFASSAGQSFATSPEVLSRGFAPINVSRHGVECLDLTTKKGFVRSAEQSFLSTITNPRPAVPVRVLRVVAGIGARPVYNLTVECVPEYYANGILVHNCIDATRYGIYSHMHGVTPRIRSLG